MGLKAWIGPVSWAIAYCALFFFISLGLAILCYATFFNATSFSLLLILILIFTYSEVAFAMMVSPALHKSPLTLSRKACMQIR